MSALALIMRLFIGLPLQEELQRRLALAWGRVSEQSPGDCRDIDPAAWHITVAHLGNVDAENMTALRILFQNATAKPPNGAFFIHEFRTFPAKHPTHIVAHAVPKHHGAWKDYVLRLRDMLSLVAPNIDRRPWIPHISISRSRKHAILPEWGKEMKEPLLWIPDRISMVESRPSQDGAVYHDLYDLPLNL